MTAHTNMYDRSVQYGIQYNIQYVCMTGPLASLKDRERKKTETWREVSGINEVKSLKQGWSNCYKEKGLDTN
jgi:hypothetical protein